MTSLEEIRQTLEVMRAVAPGLKKEELRAIQIILYTAFQRMEEEK